MLHLTFGRHQIQKEVGEVLRRKGKEKQGEGKRLKFDK